MARPSGKDSSSPRRRGKKPAPSRRPAKGAPPRRKGRPSGESLEKDLLIVHEDADVLVIDKPPGLLSATPPNSSETSAFRLVKRYVRSMTPEGRAWIIHRLDRDVSGLMVFAKSETAFSWLKEDFRARRVARRYLAVVEGVPRSEGESPAEGVVQSFLKEDVRGRMSSVAADRSGIDGPRQEEDRARFAVTHWKVLHSGRGKSLVELKMDSGRKHQIRVHLRELGHPIVGDPLYGKGKPGRGRLFLHARDLAFRHPATGERLEFTSPASERFHEQVGATPPPAPSSMKPRSPSGKRSPHASSRLDTSWDHVSEWYARLVEGERADHLAQVILPGTLRLLEPRKGQRILDLACGEGSLGRHLAGEGVETIGIDAAEGLVARARERAGPRKRYHVGDARDLGELEIPPCDAATCIMALMNIDPLGPVFEGLARVLKPGAPFVGVLLHPAFRAPRQTSWGLDRDERPPRKYRRVDGYLSPGQAEIVMNPGEVAEGGKKVTTWTFHRPIQAYVRSLAEAGFVVDALEEWPSLRTSGGSAAAREDTRARHEIPLFLGIRARRIDGGAFSADHHQTR